MALFIPKSYNYKHQILGILYREREADNNNGFVDIEDLAVELKLTVRQVKEQCIVLEVREELTIDTVTSNNYHNPHIKYIILREGAESFLDGKYITSGRKEFLSEIKDWMQIGFSFLAIVVATITFAITFYADKRIDNTIQRLENRVFRLESKPQTQTLPILVKSDSIVRVSDTILKKP